MALRLKYLLLAVSLLGASEVSCFSPTNAKPGSPLERTGKTLPPSPSCLAMSSSPTSPATAAENPRKVGLALQLDDGTRKSHSVAQNSAFVTGFFKGLSNKESYSKLLTSLHFVYKEMEDAFDCTDEELVRRMDDPLLRRVDAVQADMEYFYGKDWRDRIVPSAATVKYIDRIRKVAADSPKLLIAHQYTRYLGDLFGGQMMGGMATKSLNLLEGKGIEFYSFDEIDNTTDFITRWYTKLNELDLSDEEKSAIVDEANLVFALNIEILEELDGSAVQAVLFLVWRSFKERIGLGG